MHTTGSTVEPIGGLYEGVDLAAALEEARARTLAVYGHLDLATLEVPRLGIVNPPLWELSHIAWFQERWCHRFDAGKDRLVRDSMLPRADALFDSSAVPHDSRWTLRYPPAAALRGYMSATLATTLERLPRADSKSRYFFELALLHEDMHGEALLMTLQTLGLPAPKMPEPLAPSPSSLRPADMQLAGGDFLMGTSPGTARFVFDNEKWAHPVKVAPFAIANAPVTQGEWLAFVEDGGYARRELWSGEGWSWRETEGAQAPLHWMRNGDRWAVRRFDRTEALVPAVPMMHLSLHEAMAYCHWARRRLPTEVEWEFAAVHGLPGRGQVWEWTATPFAPYPGFAADPYEDYSRPWFHSHNVLRGGCFFTRRRLVHERFRNFYMPHRRDVFAGLRTCAL
ncbi:MAG TPA: selenoneine synthase SenA [Ramlibacter sp.]|nr:selenoneine synthase SenA [Ramlibacter sp.]